MTIVDFYHQLNIIPPNLVRHHLEVGAVAKVFVDHWQGPAIDKDLVLRTALLHDLGNLVKYTFPLEHRKYHEVVENEAFWQQKQQELVKKYGQDADKVTEAILKEYGFKKEALLLKEIRLGKYGSKFKAISDEAKLVFLADGAVSPEGVVGVEARIADVMQRYAGNEKMYLWVGALRKNKDYLQKHLDFNLADLTQFDWDEIIKEVKNYRISFQFKTTC